MATYDSADLVTRLRRDIREPVTADFPLSTDLYAWLGQGQVDVFQRIAMCVPDAVVSAPAAMVSADGGKTWTFGTDAETNALYPIGDISIYAGLTYIPDSPLVPGVDFQMEGNKIRVLPANQAWTFTPYYQGVVLPLTLDGSTAPTLYPVQARELIVDAAAVRYAEAVRSDPSPFLERYERHWITWVGALQTQYARRNAVASTHPTNAGPRSRWFGARGLGYGYRRGY